MKTEFVRSMSLPQGVPVNQFTSLTEITTHLKGGEPALVALVNMYGRQKDSLVAARSWLSEYIEAAPLGFKQKVKTEQKKDGTTTEVAAETESDHLDRFATDVASNKFTVPGFTPAGNDLKAKTDSVWVWLQAVVNKHGAWPIDLNAAPRTGKLRNPPKYAIDGATNIIKNGTEAAWAKKFDAGYDSPRGCHIDPITYQPFTTKASKTATPDELKAVADTNLRNLAWAITEVEEQIRTKLAPEFK